MATLMLLYLTHWAYCYKLISVIRFRLVVINGYCSCSVVLVQELNCSF